MRWGTAQGGGAPVEWFHPDSFQTRCIQRFREVTDAPDPFLAGAAISLTATALGKRVMLPFAGRGLYPNLWVILVGRSSRLRKSTTLELTRRVFAQAIAVTGVKLLPQSCSYEALFDAFASSDLDVQRLGANRASTGLLMANEFAALMQNIKKRYNEGLIEVLTDIYDVPALLTRQTRAAGEVKLVEPCLNILAATTVEWLTSTLDATDLASGFLPRFLFFPANARTRTLDFPGQLELTDNDPLAREAGQIARICGAMRIDDDAKAAYVNWSGEFAERPRTMLSLPGRDAFLARLNTTCLKIAIANAAGRGVRTIACDDVARATAFIDWQDGVIERMLEEEIAFTREEQRRNTIVRIIREARFVHRAELLRASRLSRKQLDSVLDTLIAAGLVAEEFKGRRREYRLRSGEAS